jgi:mannose-6-phosphate isomerase-like protein (cupin superfamily)
MPRLNFLNDEPWDDVRDVEEMFFVLSGTPTLRTAEDEEQLSPGDVVYCPEGWKGCIRSRTRRMSP